MRVGILLDISGDYREKIQHAKDLGFDFGQLVVWDMDFYTDENAAGLKATLEEIGFEAVSLWCGWDGPVDWSYPDGYHTLGLVPDWLRDRRVKQLHKGAEFARKVGIDMIATHTGFLPDDPRDPKHVAITLALKDLCTELKKHGQRFEFETGEELPVTLALLIKEIGLDNVGINFDPANFIINGRGNPQDAMDMLGDHIFGMHAKDAVQANFGEPSGTEVQIGTGRVDFKALITKLKEHNYEGDIIIEREIPYGEERDRDVLASRDYLQKIIDEVYGK